MKILQELSMVICMHSIAIISTLNKMATNSKISLQAVSKGRWMIQPDIMKLKTLVLVLCFLSSNPILYHQILIFKWFTELIKLFNSSMCYWVVPTRAKYWQYKHKLSFLNPLVNILYICCCAASECQKNSWNRRNESWSEIL